MSETEMFKTTLMGGYDKDDVLEQMRKLRDEHKGETARLVKEIQQKNSRIEELTRRLVAKEEQKEQLEKEIKNKYQTYIDHYDSISRLVVESQIRAENIIKDAQKKADEMLRKADQEAKRRVDSVQGEVEERLAEGKSKYIAIQEEMNEIIDTVNQAQKRFMASYKEIHRIIGAIPDSAQAGRAVMRQELFDNTADTPEELREVGKSMRELERQIRKDLELEDSLDEADDLTEDDLERFLHKHGLLKEER